MNSRCVAVAGLLLLFNTIQTNGQLVEYFKWKQITFVQSDNRFGLGKKKTQNLIETIANRRFFSSSDYNSNFKLPKTFRKFDFNFSH